MRLARLLLAATMLALAACAITPAATNSRSVAVEQEIRLRVDSLLYRYSQNDQPGVIAMLDPAGFTISGSALREVVRTPDELRALMSRDFSRWKSATFSDVRDFDVRADGSLATAFFVFTYAAEGGPSMPIRLCTVWRKVDGEWLLTQSSNAVLGPPPG
ncbi:MAG TPA: nuclear transport factor 2 family protein [Steroidobacteraceae bacterium]|nr:nuclear transport factor 2 family protein [Steroidobacteraceae bacterium]